MIYIITTINLLRFLNDYNYCNKDKLLGLTFNEYNRFNDRQEISGMKF